LARPGDLLAIIAARLAQLDVNRGALDHAHRVRIKAVEWLIDDLSDHDDASAFTPEKGATEVAALPSVLSPEELAPGWQGTVVLCVAGRGSLDEASAAMLVQLLEKRGIGARVVPSEAVSVANLFRLDVTGVQMACLSYLEPGSFANPRYLVRRLRRRSHRRDRRRVLDVDGSGGRGAECTCGHARRLRRHLATAGGGTGRQCGKGGRERRSPG
jgi:hypothetical protein